MHWAFFTLYLVAGALMFWFGPRAPFTMVPMIGSTLPTGARACTSTRRTCRRTQLRATSSGRAPGGSTATAAQMEADTGRSYWTQCHYW